MEGGIALTRGAIADITNMVPEITLARPTVQVIDLRLVQTAHNNTERYRMMLSDGVHAQQAMLATQMNKMVKAGVLNKGSVVQLNEFICNLIQGRKIIIVMKLDILVETCDTIGEPRNYDAGSAGIQVHLPMPNTSYSGSNQSILAGNPHYNGGSVGPVAGRNNTTGMYMQPKTETVTTSSSFGGGSFSPQNAAYSAPSYSKAGPDMRTYGNSSQNVSNQRFQNSGMSGDSYPPTSTYGRSMPTYQQAQPPPLYQNRGPIAKNEAPARIIPIAALNPYQGRWTIKARVTAKGELRHYNNPRGDGKVFSFDLLDSDGGEIRVTCFNTVADQFYDQIDAGKVYFISRGSLKPARKEFNHLNNDYEIFLESMSTIQPCLEEDNSIPKQQLNFRSISEIEGIENNLMVDLIGVVSSINPVSTIMKKNGSETLKRSLNMKDKSGRSVEITFWGRFCNVEGQQLQNMCDSGVFPILAIKSGRVSDFGGKSVGTISTSQLFIDPDFPEAHKLKDWYLREGKNETSPSISREMSSMGRTDVRKTVSQIKDEGLGRSEKPDWISVKATVSFIKTDNFCYTACPLSLGDRQCNKKVNNNGDGNWHCDRCDQTFPECDYRYLLQLQIQDHTGVTWVTAFQEGGEQIMGVSAKELYSFKYEEQDDVKLTDVIRGVLFNQYSFKLKIKEETFSDEQRVKSTVVKAAKVDPLSEGRYLLGLIDKMLLGEDASAIPGRTGSVPSDSGTPYATYSNVQTTYGVGNSPSCSSGAGRYGMEGQRTHEAGQHVSEYGNATGYGVGNRGQAVCNTCGSVGHISQNCPRLIGGPSRQMGGGFANRSSNTVMTGGNASGGASDNCYKCQQPGHWARDCPASSAIPSAYRSGMDQVVGGNAPGGASGNCYKCQQPGHWARDCPGSNAIPSAYISGNAPGQYGFPREQMGGF